MSPAWKGRPKAGCGTECSNERSGTLEGRNMLAVNVFAWKLSDSLRCGVQYTLSLSLIFEKNNAIMERND